MFRCYSSHTLKMPPTVSKHRGTIIDNFANEFLPYVLVFLIGVCFVLFGYVRRKKRFTLVGNLHSTMQDLNTTLTTSLLMLLGLNMKPTNQEEKKKISSNIAFKYSS